MAPTSAINAAPSCLDRVQHFVSENRRALILATAAVVVAAGAAYYASSSTRPSSGKGKSKDRKPKKKSANDPDGPIIEEIKPTVEDVHGLSHHPPSLARLTLPHRKCTADPRADSCHALRGPFAVTPA
jgi:hypothetical protein